MTTTTYAADTRRTTAADEAQGLLAVLDKVLLTCADVDLGLLRSRTEAGEALLSLSALTAAMTRALGHVPGPPLVQGEGVVVVRDLVLATQLLAAATRAPTPADAGGADGDGAALEATHLLMVLLRALTPAA